MPFKVVKLGPVPSGWRMATVDEFLSNKNRIMPLISEWAIVACKDGKCDGAGYGGKGTKGCGHDGIGEMLLVDGDGGGGGGVAQVTRQMGNMAVTSDIMKLNYMDDIPEGYRLLSCDEFLTNRDAALRHMSEWAICLLTDGKCDGRGYGGKATRLSRREREESSKTNERMGEMLVARDDGGPPLAAFASSVLDLYRRFASSMDCNQIVNSFLTYSQGYKPFVLVSSCPGDSHGGVHSRVQAYVERQGWRFAPVQFSDRHQAADWKRLWKLQVEEFACETVADGKVNILEVKIDGGGAGCALERSRNMSQWWVDWIKRLGADVFEDLSRMRNARSMICPDGALAIQIGQVVVSEQDLTSFTSGGGGTLKPIRTDGVDFELHSLVLDGAKRYWCLVTDLFTAQGGKWNREASKMVTASGTY